MTLRKIKEFCAKHQKFTITVLLFACVNGCFHCIGGSKVTQSNLSKLFGIDFPSCRASQEQGSYNDMDWSAEGYLIFKCTPSEDFYLAIDSIPRPKGYKYTLSISAPGLSEEEKDILGRYGYLTLTITKGDSIATYHYGSL